MNRDARMVLPLPCRLGSYVCETARETGALVESSRSCDILATRIAAGHGKLGPLGSAPAVSGE